MTKNFFREKHVKTKVVTQLAMNTDVKAKYVSNIYLFIIIIICCTQRMRSLTYLEIDSQNFKYILIGLTAS